MSLRVSATVALAAAFISPIAALSQDKKNLPNIVIILADDLGYGDLGCYNKDSKIPTPNLDRLAQQGMRFTDAHSPSAVCSPTRYGLLTGRYPFRSPLKKGVVSPWGSPIIEPGRLTMPELLRRLGYRTACIGKWHLGWNWATKDGKAAASGKDSLSNVDFKKAIANGPTTRGFDYYFGTDVPNFPRTASSRTTARSASRRRRRGRSSIDPDRCCRAGSGSMFCRSCRAAV